MGRVDVRTIEAAQHLAFVRGLDSASFLQTPAWGEVKTEWKHESIGWFRDGDLVGTGLVLYRRLPAVGRSLAYLPEGPVLDWADPLLPELLDAMRDHLKGRGAFGIRIGPPVVQRTWSGATVKKAMADGAHRRLSDVPADQQPELGEQVVNALRGGGWRPQGGGEGFAAGQPRYVFQLALDGRDEPAVLAGMNQLWRRNIKKAANSGVEVSLSSPADLPAFHDLYRETAARDGFTPRPLGYFQQMFSVMQREDPERIRLYLARFSGEVVAATTAVRVGRHVWYSYGASSTAHREVRGSNAVQWQMIRDAIAAGASVYDMRGITETLAADDPHVGLIQFKLGTGGSAVEYVGEWDLPLNRLLYQGFQTYMARRSKP